MRALQQPPASTSRIASTYFNPTSETLHVATTDGNLHTVAFYLLDWDIQGRIETITAQTPTGTVLDAGRSFASFTNGLWAVYQVCGSVDFVFTKVAGPNSAVSGVFFGPPTSSSTTNYLVDTSRGLSQVIAETDGSGNLGAYYVRVGDELLEVMRPTGSNMWSTRFVHHDALGSVRALTDESYTPPYGFVLTGSVANYRVMVHPPDPFGVIVYELTPDNTLTRIKGALGIGSEDFGVEVSGFSEVGGGFL